MVVLSEINEDKKVNLKKSNTNLRLILFSTMKSCLILSSKIPI